MLNQILLIIQTLGTTHVSFVERKDTSTILAQTNTERGPELRDYELSSENFDTVVGRLRNASLFWKNTLRASTFAQNVIDYGYFIPFTEKPSMYFEDNNTSSLKHRDFVNEAINKILKNRCIMEVSEKPYCCEIIKIKTRD